MDQRARLIQNGPDPRRYTDLEKMVAQEDLDAVAVVLPNYLHKMGAIAALEAGKHVFCEKPMALTVPDCNEMIAVAERQRKAIQVGTQRRHSKAYQDVIEIFRGAYLGRILSSDINSYRGDWRTPAEDEYPPGVEYWRLNQAQSGGVVYEMGAHIIDVNNWILDSEPVTVVSLQGVNNPILPERDSMDHAGVLVRYANGALTNYGGNLYAHGSVAPNFYYSVNGTTRLTDDRIEVNYRPGSGARSGEPLDMELPRGDGTVDQWKYFVRVLAGEAPPYPDGPAARQTIQICQASVISAQERTVVQVSDLG
jgi:predicted dehydrogenase